MERARVKCSQGMPPALDTRRAQPGQRELSGAGQGVAGALAKRRGQWGLGKELSGKCFGNQGTLLAGSLIPRPVSRSWALASTSTGPSGQEPWAGGQRGGPERTQHRLLHGSGGKEAGEQLGSPVASW